MGKVNKNTSRGVGPKPFEKGPVNIRDRKMESRGTLGHAGGERSSNTREPAQRNQGK